MQQITKNRILPLFVLNQLCKTLKISCVITLITLTIDCKVQLYKLIRVYKMSDLATSIVKTKKN